MNPAALLLAVGLLAPAPPAPRAPTLPDPPEWLVHGAIASQGVGQFSDGLTTMYAMGTGGFTEANPLLRWAEDRPVWMGVAKGTVAAVLTYTLIRLHRTRPKTTLVAAIGLTVLQAWVTHHNLQTIRHQRPE